MQKTGTVGVTAWEDFLDRTKMDKNVPHLQRSSAGLRSMSKAAGDSKQKHVPSMPFSGHEGRHILGEVLCHTVSASHCP